MKTLLIVPCFNEESRLQLKHFEAALSDQLSVLFVDDGSRDNTAQKLKEFQNRHSESKIYVHILPFNVGKAEAIRQAYIYAKDAGLVSALEWVGYWDADLATPLYEVQNMIEYASFVVSSPSLPSGGAPGSKFVEAIFGSRVYRLGSHIVRSPLRHYLGRAFATLISVLLKIESYDSQCGAKLFRPQAAEKAFAEPFLSRWIFDVEILLRLQQRGVIEYPLFEWKDIPGSKVKIAREIFRVFREILAMRKKYFRPNSSH